MTVLLHSLATDGYLPGAASQCAARMSCFYAALFGVDRRFEADTVGAMHRFIDRFDARHDGFWTLRAADGPVLGSLAIDGNERRAGRDNTATLRWFYLDDALRGRGLGRRLLAAALSHVRSAHYDRVVLHTHERLGAAVRLYEAQGFVRVGTESSRRWGVSLRFQRYALELTRRVDHRDEAFDPHPGSAMLVAA